MLHQMLLLSYRLYVRVGADGRQLVATLDSIHVVPQYPLADADAVAAAQIIVCDMQAYV